MMIGGGGSGGIDIGGGGGAGIKQTPRVFQGDVVYGTFLDKDTKQQPIILGLLGRTDKVKDEKGVYGGYQAIMLKDGVYYGASESRKDGHASGY